MEKIDAILQQQGVSDLRERMQHTGLACLLFKVIYKLRCPIKRHVQWMLLANKLHFTGNAMFYQDADKIVGVTPTYGGNCSGASNATFTNVLYNIRSLGFNVVCGRP